MAYDPNNSFLKSLTAKNLERLQQTRPATGGSFGPDYLTAVRNAPVPEYKPEDTGWLSEQSTIGKVIDVLSRPGYAVGNYLDKGAVGMLVDGKESPAYKAMQETLRKASSGDVLGAVGSAAKGAWDGQGGAIASGVSGRSKVMPSDALLKHWEPTNVGGAGARMLSGLAVDIGVDPLTYIPGGAIAAGAKAIPGVTKATSKLKATGNAVKDAKELPEILHTPSTARNVGEVIDEAVNVNTKAAKIKSLAPDNIIKEEPAAPSFNFPSFLADSVKKAATVKRTEDGKRVYDLKQLPSLYAAVKSPTAAKVAEATEEVVERLSPADWAKKNADLPIVRTDSGKVRFTDVDDADAVSLGTFLRAATEAGNKKDLDLAKELYVNAHASKAATAPGRPGTAQGVTGALDGPEAATAASGMVSGGRPARLKGAARARVLAEYADALDPADVEYLVKSNIRNFDDRVKELLSRKHSPVQYSGISDAPADSYLRRLLGEPVAENVARPVTPINATSDIAINAVSEAVEMQFSHGMKYRSKVKDVARNSKEKGVGEAVADRGFNKRAQYNMYAGIIRRVSGKTKGLSGSTRASVIKNEVLELLEESESVLRSRGIEPILGSGHTGLPLSLGNILTALDKSAKGKALLINNVFDLQGEGAVALTNISDAIQLMIDDMVGAGVKDVDEAIRFLKDVNAGSGEKGSMISRMTGEISKDPGGDYARTASAAARRAANNEPAKLKGVTRRVKSPDVWKTINGKKTLVKRGTWTSSPLGGKELEKVVLKTVKALTDPVVVKDILTKLNANSAAHNARLGYEVPEISEMVIKEFFDTWLRPTTSTGEAIHAYKVLDKASETVADGINALPESKAMADDVINVSVADEIAGDIPMVEAIDDMVTAWNKGKENIVSAGQKMHNLNAAEAAEGSLKNMVDIGDNIQASLDTNLLRAMYPLGTRTPTGLSAVADKLNKAFHAAAGHATLRPALTSMRSVARNMSNHWRSELTTVHRAFAGRSDELGTVFARIQQGTANFAPGTPEAKLQEMVKILFQHGDDGTPGAMGAFFRNGFDPEHLNGKFRQMELPEGVTFNVETAANMAKANGTEVIEELAKQWQKWEIPGDKVIDTMARLQSSLQSVTGDAAIAREGFRIASTKGMASMTKRKGFVQISDSTGSSVLAKYMPRGAWFDPEIVPEIMAMDKVLQESLNFTSEFGKFVNKWLDPALSMWKSGMTIYRPGHHVRNLIGDEGLSFLADGLQPIHHKHNALKVMALRGEYTDWDAMRALQGLPQSAAISAEKAARGEAIVSSFKLKGGKEVQLSANQVNKTARDSGMLPDFVSGEDLIESVNPMNDVQQAMSSVFKGKVRAGAGKVSEARDDYVRLSHFLHILEKNSGKFSSIDEAMEFAAARTKKHHPDGTDLSNFGSKYMRRMFPFYSWTAKSIPLVAEAMLMQPGRILAFPKAMYNMAQANGIDVSSMGDPFPEDQLFPSFITDSQTGPSFEIDGDYYAISPGLPNVDLMNQFLGDPKEAVTSMLSPFIKAPIELSTGTNMSTGSQIRDYGEYIESLVPGLSHAGSLTGTSPVGTMGNVLSGDANIDQKRATVKAEEAGQLNKVGPFNTEALLNFFTGLGIQNQSKQSYVNIAEMEKAAKAAREAGK